MDTVTSRRRWLPFCSSTATWMDPIRVNPGVTAGQQFRPNAENSIGVLIKQWLVRRGPLCAQISLELGPLEQAVCGAEADVPQRRLLRDRGGVVGRAVRVEFGSCGVPLLLTLGATCAGFPDLGVFHPLEDDGRVLLWDGRCVLAQSVERRLRCRLGDFLLTRQQNHRRPYSVRFYCDACCKA